MKKAIPDSEQPLRYRLRNWLVRIGLVWERMGERERIAWLLAYGGWVTVLAVLVTIWVGS